MLFSEIGDSEKPESSFHCRFQGVKGKGEPDKNPELLKMNDYKGIKTEFENKWLIMTFPHIKFHAIVKSA